MSRELSLHSYWDSNTSEERVDVVERAFKMIDKQSEYIKLMEDELNDVIGMASIHGWQSKRVQEGIKLRNEIDAIK